MEDEELKAPQLYTEAMNLPDGKSDIREIATEDWEAVVNYTLAQRYRNALRVVNHRWYFGLECDRSILFKWLRDPVSNQKHLRDISNFMYIANGQYARLCNYQPDMVKFAYIIAPYLYQAEDMLSDEYKMSYRTTAQTLDTMNIRTEFNKVLRRAVRDGVAYGYARASRDVFNIYMLNPNYCRISSIDGSGCIRFEFNFAYFYDIYKKSNRDAIIDSFGPEFKEKWDKYTSKQAGSWQEIGENGICVKYQEDVLEYSIPPYIAVLDSLFDLEDYRKLAKAKEEAGSYNLLNFTVPTTTDGKITMDLQLVKQFINQVSSEIPETIGVIYTPMKADKISFARDTTLNDRNAVTEALEQFWSASGVSELLFGSGKSSANGLNKSIIADEINIYPLVRQVERWINRRLRISRGKYKFKVKILDITSFNEVEMYDVYAKAGNSGLPVKNAMAACLGYTPYEAMAMSVLENDVLQMRDTMFSQPLKSASTMSSDTESSEGGRPLMNEDDLSEGGIIARENETNIRE